MSGTPRARAVFLDRDGTIVHDPGYLGDPRGVRLLEGVGDALRRLREEGFLLVIVTNQSGIARGRYTEEDYAKVDARVREVLAAGGAPVAGSYHCPYHPEGTVPAYAREHEDRKPAPGMWLRAAEELGIDLASSYSVGDGERDVVAGKRAGTTAILLAAGRDKWPLPVGGPFDPDFTARDLREAALWILARERRPLPAAPGLPLAAPVPASRPEVAT